MIIDTHCHIYPDKIALKASQATGNFYSIPMEFDGTVSKLVEEESKAGIDKVVVCSVATTPAQVDSINNFIAETVINFPDKAVGLGAMHQDTENKEESIKNIISLGLKGVKLHPDIQRFSLDDERSVEIFRLCNKYSLPVLVHTGDKRYDFSNPDRMLPILKLFPDLIVIGAHFGGYTVWKEASEKLSQYKNFYVDCSSSFEYMTDEEIKNYINIYSPDRVLFGTDYPMWEPKSILDRFMSLNLGDEINNKILSGNAIKVYNL